MHVCVCTMTNICLLIIIDTILGSGYPARAVIAPSMYYMGVIDILQVFIYPYWYYSDNYY